MTKERIGLEMFGESMNKFIKKNKIQMLITLPAGTTELEIKDNAGGGPVMQFYIILNSIDNIARSLFEAGNVAKEDRESLTDTMLAMVKEAILSEEDE